MSLESILVLLALSSFSMGSKCPQSLEDCQPRNLDYVYNEEEKCFTCVEAQPGKLFEGDMLLTNATVKLIKEKLNPREKGALGSDIKWDIYRDGDTYEIPYTLEGLSTLATTTIINGFNEFHTKTCLRFKPRESETYYIQFWADVGCYSHVGRQVPSPNQISIGSGCETVGIVIHEIMHSLGFFHEQSRPDRDDYVAIVTENIDPEKLNNFQKYDTSVIDSLGSSYDISSVMHYPPTAFSINGLDTITLANGDPLTGTQTSGFAQSDLDQINDLYCNSSATSYTNNIILLVVMVATSDLASMVLCLK